MATITPAATFPVYSGSYANTTPPFSGTFIPTLWSGKLLENLYASTTFGAVSNTKYEGEISGYGDKVIVRARPKVTMAKYQAGMTLAKQTPVPNSIEFPIDQAYYYNVPVNDVIAAQADIDYVGELTASAGEEMKIALDTECWLACFSGAAAQNKGATAGKAAGYNLGTDAVPVVLTKDNILTQILTMATILDEQNVPETDRWLVMTPYERLLLMQSPLAQAYVTGDATSPVRNGKVGRIDRFDIYESNLLPTGTATTNWDGTATTGLAKRHAMVAGHKMAMTYAAQITKTEKVPNPDDFGDLLRGLTVYGRKVLKPEALVTCVVAG